jgi:hypothetical protein
MLVTAVLPFCDFRKLADAGFSRLGKPKWPSPKFGHVRGIGGVRRRRLLGFASWIGESNLVCGVPAMAIGLPRRTERSRFRLIRKACYFDNIVNGRIEFLVRVDPEPATHAEAAATARFLLERPIKLRRFPNQPPQPLARMGHAAAHLWAAATVKRGSNTLEEWITVRNPIVVIETEAPLVPVQPGVPAGVHLSIEGNGKPFELFTINPPSEATGGRNSQFRASARTIRTYLLRMLQDVEALSQICALEDLQLDDDRVQDVFNEYTRHILRWRAEVENSTDLTAYCYIAFAELYPAYVADLRSQVVVSSMRGNVRKKLLEFLDEVEKAILQVNIGEVNMGDTIGGDKYEVSNSPHAAVGPGAQAAGGNIINQEANADLVAALRELAGKVREADNNDAAVEAELIESAAAKAEEGDEKGAAGLLKKVGKWALDVGTTVGTAALTGFLKMHGIG